MLSDAPTADVRYPLSGASRAIVQDLLRHGPRSRAELAGRLRLSPGSLTRLTKPLIDAALLKEGTAVNGGQGRPSTPLEIDASNSHFIGVKLTADEAFGVLVDLQAQVLATRSCRITDQSPEAVAQLVSQLITELAGDNPSVTSVGVTFGGHSPDRATAFAPFLHWSDVPLAAMVKAATGLDCVLDNDVVAFTEAQHWFGAGRGLHRFALVTIGAGMGYALVMHDRIVRGQEADVNVFGHYVIDRTGPYCTQGHRGCTSAYLTSDALAATASAVMRRQLGYDEVLDLVEGGDEVLRRVVDEAGLALGRLLGAVANLSMATNIILAGEGARLAEIASGAVASGLTESSSEAANPVGLNVQLVDFFEWARGAAVIAMQSSIVGSG